jgi:hypothetical protein
MPEGAACLPGERGGLEALEFDAAGEAVEPRALEREQGGDLGLGARRHDQPLARVRPAAQPRVPGGCVAPARGWPRRQRAQEGKLGAVQLPHDRQRGEGTQGSLVRRRQMVEVEQIGAGGAGAGERLRPGCHEALIGGIVDRGEDAIGPGRPVLVGGLEGDRRRERIGELERPRVVDRRDVDPGVEASGMRRIAGLAERAGGERHLPARLGQCPGERAGHLRRAAAREEEQRRTDPTPRPRRVFPSCYRCRLACACLPHWRIFLEPEDGGRPTRSCEPTVVHRCDLEEHRLGSAAYIVEPVHANNGCARTCLDELVRAATAMARPERGLQRRKDSRANAGVATTQESPTKRLAGRS